MIGIDCLPCPHVSKVVLAPLMGKIGGIPQTRSFSCHGLPYGSKQFALVGSKVYREQESFESPMRLVVAFRI